MELCHLRYFDAIAAAGSITRARLYTLDAAGARLYTSTVPLAAPLTATLH